MRILKNKIQISSIVLLMLFQITACYNNPLQQPHLAWVHVYQSTYADSFVFQNQVYNLQVGQLADSLQPKYGLPFCASNFKLPFYFCTDAQLKNIADTTIILQSDTAKDYRTRTYTTLHYNHDGALEKYTINGQRDVYEATYIYNPEGKITIISERNNKVECSYDSLGNIANLVLIDGNKKELEKLRIEYLYD
jgi:hypothetical protein